MTFSSNNTEDLAENGHLLKQPLSSYGVEIVEEAKPIEFAKGYLIAAQDKLLWGMQVNVFWGFPHTLLGIAIWEIHWREADPFLSAICCPSQQSERFAQGG